MQIVKPYLSTTALTCGTTAGSTTVTSSAAFGSVVVGQAIFGAGIPFDTFVLTVTSASSIEITNRATATSASVSLQFSYFTSAAYTTLDCLGFPFKLNLSKIGQIYVIDADKQVTSVKGYVFNDVFTPTADNAAFAPSDADAAKICGYFTVAANQVLSANHLMASAITDMPLWLGNAKNKWCQLVVVGTPTLTVVNGLTVNFMGE